MRRLRPCTVSAVSDDHAHHQAAPGQLMEEPLFSSLRHTATHLLSVHCAEVAPKRLLRVPDLIVHGHALCSCLPVELNLLRLLVRNLYDPPVIQCRCRKMLGNGGKAVEGRKVAVARGFEFGWLAGEALVAVRLELQRLVQQGLESACADGKLVCTAPTSFHQQAPPHTAAQQWNTSEDVRSR